jgi:hypothetical protein
VTLSNPTIQWSRLCSTDTLILTITQWKKVKGFFQFQKTRFINTAGNT